MSNSCHGLFLPNQCPGRKQTCGQILPIQWHYQNDCQCHQGYYYISFWAPGTIHTCGIELPAKKTKISTAYIKSIALVPKFVLPQEKLVVY